MQKYHYNKNMKKILSIFTCILALTLNSPSIKAEGIQQTCTYIEKGTFLKAISPVEISTEEADVGDSVYFINTSDMYIGDINVIPKGSKLTGTVEDIREPVQGTNAAIKIKILNIITTDKKTIPVDAYLFGDNDNYIGGEMTPAAYYHRMPHYTKGWKAGVLQYTPSNIRSFGEHKVIKAGSEVLIILNEDLKLL